MSPRPMICTCCWSPVNTATIDPPHQTILDPYCAVHGYADEAYEQWRDEQFHDDPARMDDWGENGSW